MAKYILKEMAEGMADGHKTLYPKMQTYWHHHSWQPVPQGVDSKRLAYPFPNSMVLNKHACAGCPEHC